MKFFFIDLEPFIYIYILYSHFGCTYILKAKTLIITDRLQFYHYYEPEIFQTSQKACYN